MIKKIQTKGAVLHTICDAMLDPEKAREVAQDLRDTVAQLNNCAGLAAPQISHMYQVILVKV